MGVAYQSTDARMRTRTFFGLILLVAALIVSSTPALLQPTADGVEHLAVEAGVLPDQAKLAKERERRAQKLAKERGIDVDERLAVDGEEQLGDDDDDTSSRLMLSGHVLEENGDLRDTKAADERAATGSRLEAGTRRASLPGQLVSDRGDGIPRQYQSGSMVLDEFGCPTFGAWDPIAMWDDPTTKAQWLDKAAEADDPGQCREFLEQLVARARAAEEPSILAGDRRTLAASVRGTSERLLIQRRADAIYASIFEEWADAQDLADDARASLGPAAAS